MTLKLALQLSRKALFPSSMERQNVSLVCKVFHNSNVSAMEALQKNGVCYSEGTVRFLKLIIKWWNIANVEHPYKGQRLRETYCEPIKDRDDVKLKFFENFLLLS